MMIIYSIASSEYIANERKCIMYLYSVYGYEGGYTLTHDKEFTKDEFKKMCKEAPLGGLKFNNPFYSDFRIKEYLITEYGFKDAEFTAGFFMDGDVE